MSRRARINKGFVYFEKPDKRYLKIFYILEGFEEKKGRCRLPNTRTNKLILQQAGFYIFNEPVVPTNPFRNDPNWKDLENKLRHYQIEGLCYLEHYKKIILGDQQGLGKTVQILCWLLLHPELYPVIIVCPSHLKENWRRECLKWAGENAEILKGRTPYPVSSDVLIINYEILSFWTNKLKKLSPQVLCIDECQRIMNRKAKRTIASKKLSKAVDYFFPMSGTPIKNRPEEFYPVLNMIAPDEFPSFPTFAARYCDPKKKGQWWDYSGNDNTDELHDRINKRLMIRRKKSDVLKDLPPKEIIPIMLDVPHEDLKDYRKLLHEYYVEKGSKKKDKTLRNWMEELKKACLIAKMPTAIEWIKDFLDSGEKLITFTTHHYSIDLIKEAFPGCAVLDGRVTGDKKRQHAIDSFMEDPNCKLFAGNLKSAGEGLTLTSASAVVAVELGWNRADHEQGEDRVHRIGQLAEHIYSYFLIVPNTIEEKLWDMILSKEAILGEIIDGKSTDTKENMLLIHKALRKEAFDAKD